MYSKTRLLITACLSALTGMAHAASDNVSFRRITMQDGLTSNSVNSVYRDGRGFVWISTDCGLNRFDGYAIKAFSPYKEDSTTGGSANIGRVWDIDGERLLVSANKSFFIFDKRTEQFSNADSVLATKGVSPLTSVVTVDKNRNIWIANGHACAIRPSTQAADRQRKVDGFSHAPITSFFDRDDKMYAAHSDGGISIFSQTESGDWRLEKGIDAPTDAPRGHFDIFTDSQANIWLIPGDSHGLWLRTRSQTAWQKCDDTTPTPLRMPSFIIHNVIEDCEGRIWVASNHGGINIIDLRSGECTEIRSRKNSPRSILSNSISDLYADSQGCVWVGDVKLGISVFGEPIYKFKFDNLESAMTPPDFAAQVNCIAEDANGHQWFGTNDNGLLRLDPKTGESAILSHSGPNSLPSNIVVSICPDKDGGLWVGTFLGGMCHFDGRHFKCYKGDHNLPKAASSGNIWSIVTDSASRLWVGSLGQGVTMLDPKTGKWTSWTDADGLPSNYVTKVTPMANDKVAIGTSEGLCILSVGQEPAITTARAPRLGTNIVDLYFDSRGLLWACTGSGLFALDGNTTRLVQTFNTRNGLNADATLGIAEDRRRVMWLSTSQGIASIDVLTDDADTATSFRVYNYNDQDGSIVGSINERATVCTANGEIIIGRANGVDRFRPEDIKYNTEKPVVTFTSLSTFGEETPIGPTDDDGRFTLEKALTYCDKIILPYDVNMFTVYFSTLTTILPEKVTYEYMLDGFSTGWIKTTENHASYTNLSPGQYKLRVRAANCDGKESEEAATLKILILPPWWRTTAAYIAYVLLALAAIALSIKWIRDRDKAKFRLRQMMADIEHERKVDDMKLRFFTNISHELRTPLSLIVSPLENILSKMPSQDPDRSQIELIHRNSLKLLNMVNQLLDFRKADMGGMALNLSEGDLANFVEQNCEAYIALDKKDVKFSFSKQPKNIYIRFDKDKIGKIITNLLSNAYKFTPAGGLVSVSVGLDNEKNMAFIKVADTGIGIADEHKAHIFERFYQVPQADSSIAGSGIGLHLVKDFVAMHGGTVAVSDNEGGGTVFTVEIPASPATETDKAERADDDDDIASTERQPADGAARKRIVIVDDNPDFLTLLRDTLSDEYDTHEAHDGKQALNLIIKTLPDLIITDVMMPVMDGNELCRKVKGDIRTSHIPLIMLTAKVAEEHNIEGLTNGADDYLTKPFNPQILRLKVKKMIEQGEKRQQAFKNQIEPEPSQITITTLDEQLIKRAIDYVEDNIASPTLSVEDLSKSLGMSRVHLYKKLTTITGRSPIEFIRVLRLKRAAQMLKDPSQNVSDVAYAVGFNNPKYFTKYFKEEFGVLPSKYCQQATDTPKTGTADNNK